MSYKYMKNFLNYHVVRLGLAMVQLEETRQKIREIEVLLDDDDITSAEADDLRAKLNALKDEEHWIEENMVKDHLREAMKFWNKLPDNERLVFKVMQDILEKDGAVSE